MALLKYLVRKGLPDPNGPLSEALSPREISDCNDAVRELTSVENRNSEECGNKPVSSSKKRGKYSNFTPEDRASIAKYAAMHGPAATMRHFSKQFPNLKECTVRYLRDTFRNSVVKSRKRKLDFNEPEPSEFQRKKRGRKCLLGDELDQKVQLYIDLQTLRKSGSVINTSICLGVAEGIVTANDRSLLDKFGGPVSLKKSWAQSLMNRLNMVKRRGSCTAKVHIDDDKFHDISEEFLNRIETAVKQHNIPPQLIYNWDHTGLNYVSVSSWTMETEGSKKVPIVGLDDKRQITAVFAGTLSGDFLPPQLVYQGKTTACHPNYDFPLAWSVTQSPNHWANEETQLLYTKKNSRTSDEKNEERTSAAK